MAWLVAVAGVLIAIGVGLVGMFTHNNALFIGGWIASFVAILALMGAVWSMLLGVRRNRARHEGEDDPDGWRDD